MAEKTQKKKTQPQTPKITVPELPKSKHRHVLKTPSGDWKVLLIEDVEHVGRAGEVVAVRPGFARNYLFPHGLATFVTEHNIERLQRYRQRVEALRAARLADLKALAEQLRKETITIEARANEQGHLYGSVGPEEIAAALKARNFKVEPDMVRMEGPIKEVALYAVRIHLAQDIESEVKVLVIGAGSDKAEKQS
ncbi:MAG: 50S ribosomal protein L9 [Gemmataceae bacterium]